MKLRVSLPGLLGVSLLLTGCPLVDHYELLSDAAGAPSAGSDLAGSDSVGGTSPLGGMGGMVATGGSEAPSGGSTIGGGSGTAGTAGSGTTTGGSSGRGATAGEAGDLGISGAAMGGIPGAAGAVGTAGEAGAPSGLGCGVSCSAQACCENVCADIASDRNNCGACGNACSLGRDCTAGACAGGWVAMTPPVGVVARSRAASVAIGKSVFFWGGLNSAGKALDDGAIYTPLTDSWVVLSNTAGRPSPRVFASAVWTGRVVVVYGGTDAAGTTVYRDGSVYNPTDDSWTALPPAAMGVTLRARSSPFGFWDGARAVFFGGLNAQGNGVSGADRFEPISATWSTAATLGEPAALLHPALAADGSTLYLQGGTFGPGLQDKVYSYSSGSNTWSSLNKGPSARSLSFSAWDGSHFVVWGGRDTALLRDGMSLSGTVWTSLVTTGAPIARGIAFQRSGWSFGIKAGVVGFLGGQTSLFGSGTFATNGGSYDQAASKWSAISNWPSGETHEYGMGVWTGDEFVLWGGGANAPTTTGERWAP